MLRSLWRRIGRGVRRLLIGSVIACALVIQPPNSSAGSVAADSSVTLTKAEADSLVVLIDDLDLEVRLLRIDLRQVGRKAAVDSTLMAERMRLQQQTYEQIIELHKREKENFIVRALKPPAIWFMVGAYAGLQATR